MLLKAPATSDKSKQKSMNDTEKKGDKSKVRRKRKSREEAKEDENLAKRIMTEGGDTVSKVKERYQLSETSATNGPQGTVSQKTQVSVSLLKKGIERLYKNVVDINPQFVDDLLLETLLTTVVENLHAVSHLKHETFTVLTYAQDFGTICKESLKRTSRWAAKYYTHDN